MPFKNNYWPYTRGYKSCIDGKGDFDHKIPVKSDDEIGKFTSRCSISSQLA